MQKLSGETFFSISSRGILERNYFCRCPDFFEPFLRHKKFRFRFIPSAAVVLRFGFRLARDFFNLVSDDQSVKTLVGRNYVCRVADNKLV